MKYLPKVSIIIPVFNGSNYMREAIDSALSQTYKNIEVIVVNDGSKDDGETEEIALSYGKKIKYYSKNNGGVSTAFNYGISKMSGEYFSWLSHDDIYCKDKIELQINYLKEHKLINKKVVLYTNFTVISDNGKTLYDVIHDHEYLIEKPEYALLKGAVNGNTILVPKKVFEETGLFREDLKVTQDYDMWFRMMNTYKFIHLPIITVHYRLHKYNDTKTNPRVIFEGNNLWIKLVNESPFKNKLEKNELMFYETAHKYISNAQIYKEAEDYINLKIKNYNKTQKHLKNITINQPMFSIIMAIYNTEDFLEESILSVINQTLSFKKHVELILINDGSTDSSEKICLKYQKLYPDNIRYIKKKNGGVSSSRNKGLQIATGKYYNFLDSDDKLSLNALEEVFAFFCDNGKDIDVVAIRPIFFGAKNGATSNDNTYKQSTIIDLKKDINNYLQSVSTSFIKAEMFEKIWFNTELSNGEDGLVVNTILLNKFKFGVISNASYFIRIRNSGDSATDLALKKKTLYTNTVEYYFVNLFNKAIQSYESVPLHLQTVMVQLIYWVTQSPDTIKELLNKKEQQQFADNIKWLVDNIEEKIIKESKISKIFKKMLLNIKNADNIDIFILKPNFKYEVSQKLEKHPTLHKFIKFCYKIVKKC